VDLNDGKKVWSGLKSKLGLKPKGEADPGYDEAYYGEGYDDAYGDYDGYAAYGDGYDPAYEEGYDDAYGAYDQGYDAYGSDSRGSSRSRGSSLPRLVSMSDARASARSGLGYQGPSSPRTSSSRGFSTGRAVYDSSLPYEMTPEGSAAVSARGTRRYEEGFVSPYEAVDAARPVSAGYADEALSRASGSFGASGDIQSRTSASLAALRERKGFATTLQPQAYRDIAAEDEHLLFLDVREKGQRVLVRIAHLSDTRCTDFYTASNDRARATGAATLAVWRFVERAKAEGCRVFDFGGIDPAANRPVFEFKRGLCTDVVQHNPLWVYSRTPALRKLAPVLLALR